MSFFKSFIYPSQRGMYISMDIVFYCLIYFIVVLIGGMTNFGLIVVILNRIVFIITMSLLVLLILRYPFMLRNNKSVSELGRIVVESKYLFKDKFKVIKIATIHLDKKDAVKRMRTMPRRAAIRYMTSEFNLVMELAITDASFNDCVLIEATSSVIRPNTFSSNGIETTKYNSLSAAILNYLATRSKARIYKLSLSKKELIIIKTKNNGQFIKTTTK